MNTIVPPIESHFTISVKEVSVDEALSFWATAAPQARNVRLTALQFRGDAAQGEKIQKMWERQFNFSKIAALPRSSSSKQAFSAACVTAMNNSDIVSTILMHNDLLTLAPLRRVSKRWCQVIDRLPTRLSASPAEVGLYEMSSIVERFHYLEQVEITSEPDDPLVAKIAGSMFNTRYSGLEQLTNLRTLRVDSIIYSTGFSRLTKLESLGRLDRTLSSEIVSAVPYWPHLTRLEVFLRDEPHGFDFSFVSTLDRLVHLSLQMPVYPESLHTMKNFHTFTQLTRLEFLSIPGLSCLLIDEHDPVLARLTNLRSLRTIPFRGIHLPHLRSLHLASEARPAMLALFPIGAVAPPAPLGLAVSTLRANDLPSLTDVEIEDLALSLDGLSELRKLALWGTKASLLPHHALSVETLLLQSQTFIFTNLAELSFPKLKHLHITNNVPNLLELVPKCPNLTNLALTGLKSRNEVSVLSILCNLITLRLNWDRHIVIRPNQPRPVPKQSNSTYWTIAPSSTANFPLPPPSARDDSLSAFVARLNVNSDDGNRGGVIAPQLQWGHRFLFLRSLTQLKSLSLNVLDTLEDDGIALVRWASSLSSLTHFILPTITLRPDDVRLFVAFPSLQSLTVAAFSPRAEVVKEACALIPYVTILAQRNAEAGGF